jgi:hypothetical protein
MSDEVIHSVVGKLEKLFHEPVVKLRRDVEGALANLEARQRDIQRCLAHLPLENLEERQRHLEQTVTRLPFDDLLGRLEALDALDLGTRVEALEREINRIDTLGPGSRVLANDIPKQKKFEVSFPSDEEILRHIPDNEPLLLRCGSGNLAHSGCGRRFNQVLRGARIVCSNCKAETAIDEDNRIYQLAFIEGFKQGMLAHHNRLTGRRDDEGSDTATT